MNKINPIFFSLFFLTFIFSEKTSDEIQRDIDKRNNELDNIKQEIERVEKLINSKINEEKTSEEIIEDINRKIVLKEKLIESLNKEEIYLSNLIYKTEQRIVLKEKELEKLQNQLKNRVRYIYKYGKSNTMYDLLNFQKWNKSNFRIKYLNILNKYENDIKTRINSSINNLKDEKDNLKKEKNRKEYLLDERNKEFSNLENDKKLKIDYLKNIKSEKKILESKLQKQKTIMAEIERIINTLYKDKKELKLREEELRKIRAQKNKSTSGNFAKMKGKLPWPTKGNIINKFGIQSNNKLNTLYENIGIDIKTKANEPVFSVLDGVVSSITYIREYGNVIIIDHGEGYYTVYSNIENIQVNENDYIDINNKIADVTTDQYSDYILHFEVWGNQKKLNPETWLVKK